MGDFGGLKRRQQIVERQIVNSEPVPLSQRKAQQPTLCAMHGESAKLRTVVDKKSYARYTLFSCDFHFEGFQK
jgi:hypothetical protein